VELVAVADPHPELLEKVKAQVPPGVQLYADYVKMLDEVKPDAVTVTVPNSEHIEVLRACAARHVHVWFQKPMATTYKDAVEMERLAREAGIKLMISYHNLWTPAMQALAARVKAVDVGPVQRMIAQNGFPPSRETRIMSKYYSTYFRDPARQGGGALMDQGTYGINWALWILGRPTSVYAVAKRLRNAPEFPTEDEAWLMLSYPNATAIIQGSWSMPAYGSSGGSGIQFIGPKGNLGVSTEGKAYFKKAFDERVEPNATGEPELIETPPLPPGRQNGVAHFIYCLRNDKPIDEPHTARLNVMVSEIVDAAYESIRTGRAITLLMH
jgi:predicted dehydrogenase